MVALDLGANRGQLHPVVGNCRLAFAPNPSIAFLVIGPLWAVSFLAVGISSAQQGAKGVVYERHP